MKQTLLLLLLVVFTMACSTTKEVRSSQKGLNGDWTLASITTDKGNLVEIKELFNQAPPQCFEGSKWHFVNNNNSGTYIFQNPECDGAVHDIKWFMQENGEEISFLWKFIPVGVKAKDVKAGYNMQLLSESENDFVLAQQASFEGSVISIYYQFVRN